VAHRDLTAFIKALELDGVSGLRITPEGERAEYHTVVFVEPMADASRDLMGRDLAVDAVRREAMDRARDTGEPALAPHASTLAGDAAGDRAILFVPVYRTGIPTTTVDERRQAHALDVVERNARLQARLIEDLLDVSRILLGRMSIDLQPLAVAPAVAFVIDSLRPAAEAGGVELQGPSSSDRA
jgi:signal transduction histidine kinase